MVLNKLIRYFLPPFIVRHFLNLIMHFLEVSKHVWEQSIEYKNIQFHFPESLAYPNVKDEYHWQPSINFCELKHPSKSLLATRAQLFMNANKQTSQDTRASRGHN